MESAEARESPPFDLCERTFALALRVINICLTLYKKPGIPRSIISQLLDAGTSVGANVEEGQAAQSKPDFISKYAIARKETRETRYWLRLMVASKLLETPDGQPLIGECEQLIKIFTASIRKAEQSLPPKRKRRP